MNLYEQYKTDPKVEQDGTWIIYGTNSKGDDISFLIARAGGANMRFVKLLEKSSKPYRRAINTGTLDNETADKIFKSVFADTVVLNWQGVEDSQGNILPYSRGNVIKLFDDLPDLFADIREQANNLALYREEALKQDLGKSGDT